MKFRAGDVVSIQAKVKFNFDEGDEHVSLEAPGLIGGTSLWAEPDLVTVVKQGIVIGDRVKWDAAAGHQALYLSGQVLAIANDHAWIDMGGSEYCTRLLSSIQRDEA